MGNDTKTNSSDASAKDQVQSKPAADTSESNKQPQQSGEESKSTSSNNDTKAADEAKVSADAAAKADAAAAEAELAAKTADDKAAEEAIAAADAEETAAAVTAAEAAEAAALVASADDKAGEKPSLTGTGSVVETRSHGLQGKDADQQILEVFDGQLNDYISKMGRAVPVTSVDGAIHQVTLFNILKSILRQEGSVFTKSWSLFLSKVSEQLDGAFNEARAFRFFELMKIEDSQKHVFMNLIHLAISTADPKGRQQALKLIDLPTVTKSLSVPGATEKLIAYYAP